MMKDKTLDIIYQHIVHYRGTVQNPLYVHTVKDVHDWLRVMGYTLLQQQYQNIVEEKVGKITITKW